MSFIRSKSSFGNLGAEVSTKKTWMENQFLPSSSRSHFNSKGKEIKVPSYIPPSRPSEDARPSTSHLSAFRRALSRVVGWFSWLSIVRCRNRKSDKSPTEKCQKSNGRSEPSKLPLTNVDIGHQAELGTPVQDSDWNRPTSDFTTVSSKPLALELKDCLSSKDHSTSSRRHTDTGVKSRKSKARRKPSALDPMTEGQVEHQEGVMYTKLQQNPDMNKFHSNVEKDKSKDLMGKDHQLSEDQPLPKESMKKKRKSKLTERSHRSEPDSTDPKVDHQAHKSKDLGNGQQEQSLPERRSKSLQARKSKNLASDQIDQPASARRSKSTAKSQILESGESDKQVPESLPSKENSAEQAMKSKDLGNGQREKSLPERRSKSLQARKSKNLGSGGQNAQPVSTRRSKSTAKTQILEPEESGKQMPESLPSDEKSVRAKKPEDLGNSQREKSLPERRSKSLQARKSINLGSGQDDQPASARRSKSAAKSQILKPEESDKQVPESLPSKEKSARQSAESQSSVNRKMDLNSTRSDRSTTKSMILECESKSMQMPTEEVSEEKSLSQEPSTLADVAAEAFVCENPEGKLPDPKMEELGTSATTSKPSPSQQKEFPKRRKKVQSKETSPITMDSICLTEDEKYNASLVGAMIGNRASKQPFHLTYGEILSQIELPPQIPPKKDPEFEMRVDDAASKMVNRDRIIGVVVSGRVFSAPVM